MNTGQLSPIEESIQLGDKTIEHVKKTHGMNDLPAGLDLKDVLTLELLWVPIIVGGIEVGMREFYLCYSPQLQFLFVAETEMAQKEEDRYQPQYGRDDNYNICTITQRILWVYTPDSPRAKTL